MFQKSLRASTLRLSMSIFLRVFVWNTMNVNTRSGSVLSSLKPLYNPRPANIQRPIIPNWIITSSKIRHVDCVSSDSGVNLSSRLDIISEYRKQYIEIKGTYIRVFIYLYSHIKLLAPQSMLPHIQMI